MKSLKAQIARSFLRLVSEKVPLEQAQVATLGGEGYEARIWQEEGISPLNGWLIEHSRSRGGALIKAHRYRHHNQLATFADILAGYGEGRSSIDGFHLDLCGTLTDTAMTNFAPVLPLVLRGRAGCLAVTTADMRRNLVLENWDEFKKKGKAAFGGEAEGIYEKIADTQRRIPVRKDAPSFFKPFDPEKASKREFGLLVGLAELIESQGLRWKIAHVERFVYVSHYRGRPFRMRTYFFRFEPAPSLFSAPEFARTWTSSILRFGNGDGFRTIQRQQQERKQQQMQTPTSRLGAVAQAIGGAELEEYQMLLAKADHLDRITQALAGAQVPGILPSVPGGAASAPSPVGGRKAKKRWESLSEAEQIEWLLKALEKKAVANGEWLDRWSTLLREDFGHYDHALGRSLRSALARTSGKFRPLFDTRIRKVFGDAAAPYLSRLSKLPVHV